MKVSDFVKQNIDLIGTATPDNVSVRTTGGSQGADPPFCILSRELTHVNDRGHSPLAGVVRDERDYAVGEELHRTKRAELKWKVRSYDEFERDSLVETIEDEYTLCADDCSYFHPNEDTYLWSVGRTTPMGNAVMEPDWYESTVTAHCHLVTRVIKDGDPIEEIVETYEYGSEF